MAFVIGNGSNVVIQRAGKRTTTGLSAAACSPSTPKKHKKKQNVRGTIKNNYNFKFRPQNRGKKISCKK